MTAYSKLIAAVVGLGISFAARHGVDLSGQEAVIVDVVTAVLTALLVYWVPNKDDAQLAKGIPTHD